ncbi:MAG: hypothetical protein COY69_02010 [Candidatus Magasanikbacteria bacterium CG_4_10_14_0_8_um_filter_32_14]|uniref:Uncharacterized protein n=1 Tax=Candidatus Magasanikbacteria bacterium CG_4_10_14_0_8_um_filter_32_14 TaxID=1974640 RepID=A0A2M7R9D9_9BACT|nr:MAG: hypothetical protein COY69_02010 [Candidatus Magasanikbacteria bacterium CG_4_10_14_0_8_um_filter_32_14]
MEDMEQYKSLISEIIAKQSVILGPDIAILKARNVGSLKLSNDGKVTSISGDPEAAIQSLIDEYVNLSGLIVKNALGSIFAKYPSLKRGE